MSDTRKKRMSMLDSLAAAGRGAPAPASGATNRALRSARDAVDSHHVWELDPHLIDDTRTRDRLNPEDYADLQAAIEENGQTVPILVRRNPAEDGRYLLVYGKRRLEAIRNSDRVAKVRALVASMDDTTAQTAQISENMARRDLSFIEKALFAKDLVDSGYGSQARVAEALTVTRSSISMAITVAETVGRDLIEAIGAAHGIGRPRWEALARILDERQPDREALAEIAHRAHDKALLSQSTGEQIDKDPSVLAFEAVMKGLDAPHQTSRPEAPKPRPVRTPVKLDGVRAGSVRRTGKGLALDLDDERFADWMTREAPALLQELHARWKADRPDDEQPK
ncbi:plasmid partitioning protein RepB [Ponticoccus alexandrii]|uniref:Plasmid partitioning protein RepB n=1 Tax=Ponticoccus alexandrii TaxID=1943633 RepID=A0ABX7FG58_9RHOB|nr:plasmid partitioning protein RepB [Ponticoccus alexandrii]ETA52245.2 Rep B partitioning protein/ParB [Rhodobacteraceae bacterium PD-2]QRF68926.1 plasmid partitioning protein RepB [Ponticoccus alexandrii]